MNLYRCTMAAAMRGEAEIGNGGDDWLFVFSIYFSRNEAKGGIRNGSPLNRGVKFSWLITSRFPREKRHRDKSNDNH